MLGRYSEVVLREATGNESSRRMSLGEWSSVIVIPELRLPRTRPRFGDSPSLNLRLRFPRALFSSLVSFRYNKEHSPQAASPAASLVTKGVYAALMLGLVAGVRAETRPAVALDAPAATLLRSPLHLSGQRYELHLHHLHTGEDLNVVYRVGDQYIPSAIAQLNHFLRDHRTQDVSSYDPREFDVLHSVLAKLGRENSVIDIVCGYRTPWSNNFLRTRSASTGVAQHSQHMLAKAIDIRIPGVTTARLRDVAMSLQAGGVGYYPVSQFVHVDVGPVRHWSFGGSGE